MAVGNKLATRSNQRMGMAAYLTNDAVKNQINQIVGGKSGPRFISSIISAVQTNPALAEAMEQDYPQAPPAAAKPVQPSYDKEISETVPMRKEIFFKVYVSRYELAALNNFLKESGITFRQIKEHN